MREKMSVAWVQGYLDAYAEDSRAVTVKRPGKLMYLMSVATTMNM